MGILATIDQSIRAQSDSSSTPGPLDDFWYNDIGLESDSGIRITPQGALNISTVWKCVEWWFRLYGTLPHKLFERKKVMGHPAAIEAVDHPLYDVIHASPNPDMTAEYFHGMIAADKKLWGNFYAFIGRGGNGKPSYLVRIRPDYVTPKIISKQLWYEITGDDGLQKKFYPDEILHLPGLGFDGRVGYSPMRMQMNLLGWNRATTRYGAQFFKNASRPSGIISTSEAMKPERKLELVENLRRSGRDAGKLLLIEGATTFTKMTMDQDEAQFILTCNMQEEDIAGVMGVYPHEIGITRNSNNSITEQLTINTVTRHLAPFCVQTEQQMNLQLLSDLPSSGIGGGTERSRYFFQSELKGLLRGDTAAQKDLLIGMFDRGIFSGNQCADYLGMPPFENGDMRVINGAYVPFDMLEEIAKRRKPGDTGAPNSAGGPPPTENQRAPKGQVFASADPTARICKSYSHLFEAAIGRTLSRKKPADREKFALLDFRPVLTGLAAAIGVEIDSEFEDRYLAALAQRSLEWESNAAAAGELARAMDALIEHGKPLENLEGGKVDA